MGTSKNLQINVWISVVSKIYPSGIQLRNLNKVSKVAPTKGGFCEFSKTYWQSVKTSENWEHMVSFKCLAFVWVIWPLEKSKTSSLRSLRMIMLFWHKDSLVLDAPMMSGMKLSQLFGHSRLRICKKTEKYFRNLKGLKLLKAWSWNELVDNYCKKGPFIK